MNGNRTSPQSGKPKKLNEVTISVPTKPFNPDGFKLYSIVITHEPELNDEQAGKKKIVEKLAVEAFLSDIGNKKKRNGDFVTIDGKTVLVFDDAEIKKACVVVKLNDGPERPDGIETYQRFFDRTAASPKVGWARVESLLPEEDGKGVVDALNQKDKQSLHRLGLDTDKQLTGALKAFAIQGGNSRLAVSMGCHDIGPKYGKDVLAGLVRASKQGDGVALATVRALLLRNEDRTTTAVRDSFFDARPTAHIQGVELRIGVTKTLHLTGESTVIMSEKPCHQLFFPATSLASLMDTHYRRLASAPSVENKQRLTKFFQGVEVKVVGGPLNATKTITDFSHLTPNLQMILAGGQQITLSSIYQQDGNQLKYEDLPSVNVGSKTRPFYVPAEACFILPNQPFRNHLSPALQRELEELKRTSSGSITNINARDVETTKLTSKADFHTPHGRNWERSTMNSAYVLFVEVGKDVGDGKGQKRFTQSFWKDFQMVFSNMSQIKFEQTAEGIIAPSIATIAKDVLLLDYVADTECSKEWVSKLKAAVVESKVALEQFALVFGIQNNADRPEIFKQLEQACNSEDLGIQSIGVNVATLRKKVNNEPNDGMVRYAGQIFRKMFARTPQLNELKGDEDLAFGIDVTKVSATKGAKEKYLISIALRDVEAKKAYGTKVKLVDPEQPLNEVSNLFAELLHDFDVVNQSSSAKLIVFRSGCTLPVKANDRPSTGDINVYDEGIKDEKAELAKVELHRENHDENDRRASKAVFIAGNAEATNDDLEQYTVYHHQAGTGAAKAVKLTLIAAIKAYQQKEQQVEARSSPLPIRSRRSSAGSTSTAHSPTIVSAAKKRKSGGGEEQVTPTKQSTLPRKPLSPRSGNEDLRKTSSERKSSLGQQVGLADVPAPHSPCGSANGTLSPVDFMSQIGRDAMAKLFYDNHVGMHESKYPIPVFLAKRAAGWATTHMEKKKMAGPGGKTLTTNYVLPKVHKNREKTLWYL